MSIMEFYPSTGTEENLSLQDMIECDIRSIPNGDQWRAQTPNSDSIMPLAVVDGFSTKSLDSDQDTWMQSLSQTSTGSGIQENTNPNLLVNPQTGLPIGQEPVTLTLAQPVTTSVNDSSTIQTVTLQQNVEAQSQPIQVTAEQYVNINNVMQVISSTQAQQQIFMHPHSSTVTSQVSSPLRQQLQNLHQLQSSHTANVTYAATQQLLTAGLQSPQKITLKTMPLDNDSMQAEKVYPKPVYSYSCLIAMALKNSDTGCLPVSEIYNFMT